MLQKQSLFHTLFFILGFSIIFFALGMSASFIGQVFSGYQDLIRQLGGLMIGLMGLFMLGMFTPKLFMKYIRFEWNKKPLGYLGSVLVGITYAAGWTPCVGPILTAVLALGVVNPGQAVVYTVSYTLGFAVPFLTMSLFLGRMQWVMKYSIVLMKVGGVLMILTGVLLFTDQMTKITTILIGLYGGFTGY